MGLAVSFVRRTIVLASALTHDTLTDDECRLTLYGLCPLDGFTNLCSVVSVDFLHGPTQCAILGSGVFVHHFLGLGRELDVVGVVEHNEVVESEHTCDACTALADFLFDATIRDVCVDGFLVECGVAGMCSEELGSDGSSDGEHMTLSEWT